MMYEFTRRKRITVGVRKVDYRKEKGTRKGIEMKFVATQACPGFSAVSSWKYNRFNVAMLSYQDPKISQ